MESKNHLNSDSEYLFDAASNSLKANIVQIGNAGFLRAGANQYGGFWTRDFAFSIPGLLIIKRPDVVKNHLTRVLGDIDEKTGVLPRNLDNYSATRRYIAVYWSLKHKPKPAPIEPLKPYYLTEWDTLSFDGNLLVLRGSLLYKEATGDETWWKNNEKLLVAAYKFYDRHKNDDGLIVQQIKSDWQDTVKREGATFLTNFLYWYVSLRLMEYSAFRISEDEVEALRKKLIERFLDPVRGIFMAMEKSLVANLDGNLFAISTREFWESENDREKAYESLKKDPLWNKYDLPLTAYPFYPKDEKSFWVAKFGPGPHYQDNSVWSWLVGFSIKTAKIMADQEEAQRMTARLKRMVLRDLGEIHEVWASGAELLPLSNSFLGFRFFYSEHPFAWGSSFILDALAFDR